MKKMTNPHTMQDKHIHWTKEYHEDLGTKDEDGFYDYAYRYFMYCFTLSANAKIHVRRYTDESDKCSLFGYIHSEKKLSETDGFTVAVINFMRIVEGVREIDLFRDGYAPVDLNKLENNLSEFTFEKVTPED